MVGNSTNSDQIKLSLNPEEWWFLVIFCSFQILIGSIASFVVIVTIFVSRQLRRRSEDRLILNLAITDFFCLTTLLPWHIYTLNQQQINIKGSSFIGFSTLKALLVITGTNAILCLAIDRFVAVVYPLRHLTSINTHSMTVLSWGTAMIVAVVRYLSWKFALQEYASVVNIAYCSLFLVVSVALYAIIFYHTLKQGRDILNQRRSIGAGNEKGFSHHLLLKITLRTFVLMCLFYATYFPAIVCAAHFSLVLEGEWVKMLKLKIWINSFVFLNSCINPFVYGLRTKRFRKEFQKKIWSKLIK